MFIALGYCNQGTVNVNVMYSVFAMLVVANTGHPLLIGILADTEKVLY